MISPEFITEQASITLRQWIEDPAARLGASRTARRLFADEFGLDPFSSGISVPTPSYLTLKIIGDAELVMPDDHFFMVRGNVLESIHQSTQLRIPESIIDHPAMKPYRAQYQWLVEHVGNSAEVGIGPGTQGPITMAKLLRGQDFFADIIEYPQEAHGLLEIVTDTIIKAWTEVRQFLARPLSGGSLAIHDDFAGLMGPAHFQQFAVPCYQRIYAAFAPRLRLFHSELLRQGHLECLPEMKIDFLNLGENQYLRPSEVAAVTDVPFEWHVKTATVRDGTPALVEQEYVAAVTDGAPAVLTELCARKIPFGNIHAYVRTAQERGPFVAPGNCYAAAMKATELRRGPDRA